jgi:two-component system response regulator HupR/HoxA
VEKRTVLFIDDDEIVLQSLERGLQDEPYNKFFVNSCKEAFEILQREKVYVIVADMCMPEMTGLELIRKVRKENPRIIGMILTGYEQDADIKAAVDKGEIFRLIIKPWKLGGTSFETLVQQAVDQYDSHNKQGPSEVGKLGRCKARLKKWVRAGSDK